MVLTRDAKGGAKKGVNQLISSQRRTNVSLVSGDGDQIDAQSILWMYKHPHPLICE